MKGKKEPMKTFGVAMPAAMARAARIAAAMEDQTRSAFIRRAVSEKLKNYPKKKGKRSEE